MDIHVSIDSPVKNALQQSVQLFDFNLEHQNPDTADVIVVDSKRRLHDFYTDHQHFVLLTTEEPDTLPDNAAWFHLNHAVLGIAQHLDDLQDKLDTDEATTDIRTGTVHEPVNEPTEGTLHVLVIDDTTDNLQEALDRLSDKHYVTLAQGYDEGAKLISENKYDVVLSDCNMPVGTHHSALSMESVPVGETVPNGPYLMFDATKRGARFAVVTDANHHQDWASAIFDDLRAPQTVNGQPVLFINYMEKRWDEALEKLLNL